MTAETKYKPVPPIEQVTWLDHYSVHSKDSWTLAELAQRVKEDCVCVSVGMLVYEDEKKLTLSMEARVDEDWPEAQFSHYLTIYKNAILERKALLPKEDA